MEEKKVRDGWRDEQREGVEEQTGSEGRWKQESNLVKSEWEVLFLNVDRGGHSLGEKENGDRGRDGDRNRWRDEE